MIKVDLERRVGQLHLEAGFEADARLTALFGRSGAGKTTIVNLIAGLLRPDRGRIEIDGRVLFDSAAGIDVPVHERRVGYVFQEARLFPHLTVRRNLLYGHDRVAASERYVRFEHAVELLGLSDLLGRRPGDLSGGEKQRVAIARAIVSEPALLLADEPTGNLDPQLALDILGLLEDINATGVTVLFATHDRTLLDVRPRRVVVLDEGRAYDAPDGLDGDAIAEIDATVVPTGRGAAA